MSPRNLLMIASLALSVLIGMVLTRGGGAASGAASGAGAPKADPSKPVLIGFSMDTLKEARWQADKALFEEKVKSLGAEAVVLAANSSDTQQMKDVNTLLARGVDVLIVVPHDGQTMAKAVELAHQSHVPVIAYDRVIRDVELDLYVSFDNANVGRQQARYVVEHLVGSGGTAGSETKKARVVRIHGAPSDTNAKTLKEGQDEVLKPYIDRGAIQVVHEDWAEEWKPENAKKILNAAITKLGAQGFDCVMTDNDGTAGGAVQALTEEGLSGKVLVTGQDAELAALQRIAGGKQTMTIYKPLRILTANAADAAVKLARHQTLIANASVPNGKMNIPSILANTMAVDQGNLVATVVKDGFHTYDEIFSDVPADKRPPKP